MFQIGSSVATPIERSEFVIDWLDRLETAPRLNTVAKSLGVTRVVRTEKVAEASVARTISGFVLYLNPTRRATRQKFSVAHELAHLLIDSNLNLANRSSDTDVETSDEIEKACDAIATRLLMPKRVFERAIRDIEPSITGIKSIASQFGASLHATSIRFGDLYSRRAMVLRAEMSSRTRRLAISWGSVSGPDRVFVPQGKHVDHIRSLQESFDRQDQKNRLVWEQIGINPFRKAGWIETQSTSERPGVLAVITSRRIKSIA